MTNPFARIARAARRNRALFRRVLLALEKPRQLNPGAVVAGEADLHLFALENGRRLVMDTYPEIAVDEMYGCGECGE